MEGSRHQARQVQRAAVGHLGADAEGLAAGLTTDTYDESIPWSWPDTGSLGGRVQISRVHAVTRF
jgi:hypothetical protein